MRTYNTGERIAYTHDEFGTGVVVSVHDNPDSPTPWGYTVQPDTAGSAQIYVPADHVDDDTPATTETSTDETSTHWHAGWNVPGYLPDTEYPRFSTAAAAVDHLLDQLAGEECICGNADPETEMVDANKQCDTCTAVAEIHSIEGYERGFAVLHPDTNLVYCLHKCDSLHRDKADIRKGRLFTHGYFNNPADGAPMLCKVTNLGLHTVHYRAGVEHGARGIGFQSSTESFLHETLGNWLEEADH